MPKILASCRHGTLALAVHNASSQDIVLLSRTRPDYICDSILSTTRQMTFYAKFLFTRVTTGPKFAPQNVPRYIAYARHLGGSPNLQVLESARAYHPGYVVDDHYRSQRLRLHSRVEASGRLWQRPVSAALPLQDTTSLCIFKVPSERGKYIRSTNHQRFNNFTRTQRFQNYSPPCVDGRG